MTRSLFEQASIKGIQLKNRFVRSATAEGMATFDGFPTKALKDLYGTLADGELGLIITSGSLIEPWKNSPRTLGLNSPFAIYEDRYIEAWQDIIRDVHERGAKIAMQIGHLGMQDVPELRGSALLAPSAVNIKGSHARTHEMTVNEIQDIVEKFAQACRRVKAAGFDAVQLHGAHGNLISNFMSPHTNLRTDDYGGNIENRSRFVMDIINRSRQLIGRDYPLMMKMNFNDFVDGGLSKEDAIEIAKRISGAGMDCLEVSGGILSESKECIARKGISKETQEAYFSEYAKAVKENVSIPIMLVGGLRSPHVMNRMIENGTADFISLSRPLIREPHLIKKWKGGSMEKAGCISCNQCFEKWAFQPTRCYTEESLNAGPLSAFADKSALADRSRE